MLVGLIGYKNSGKTSISKRYFELFNPNVNMIGFSNPLYRMLGVLGISEREIQIKANREVPHPKLGGKSIQFALNSLGTNWGRKMIYENIWVDRSLDSVDPTVVNIADNIRFPNEFSAIQERGGLTVAIINPTVSDDGTEPEAHVKKLQNEAEVMIYNDPLIMTLDDCAKELNAHILKFLSR
jgi:hypothetical protein